MCHIYGTPWLHQDICIQISPIVIAAPRVEASRRRREEGGREREREGERENDKEREREID